MISTGSDSTTPAPATTTRATSPSHEVAARSISSRFSSERVGGRSSSPGIRRTTRSDRYTESMFRGVTLGRPCHRSRRRTPREQRLVRAIRPVCDRVAASPRRSSAATLVLEQVQDLALADPRPRCPAAVRQQHDGVDARRVGPSSSPRRPRRRWPGRARCRPPGKIATACWSFGRFVAETARAARAAAAAARTSSARSRSCGAAFAKKPRRPCFACSSLFSSPIEPELSTTSSTLAGLRSRRQRREDRVEHLRLGDLQLDLRLRGVGARGGGDHSLRFWPCRPGGSRTARRARAWS